MKTKTILTIAALSTLVAASTQAAVITWGSAIQISGATDVSTDGTLVQAISGSTTTSWTVNTVTFSAGQILDSTTHNDSIGNRVTAFSPTNTENNNYTSLLRTPSRNNTSVAQPITFSGLTIGQTYQIQIWATDNNVGAAGTVGLVLGNGVGTTVNPGTSGHRTLLYEPNEGEYGQYALGTFTADAVTQSLYLQRWGNLTTTPVAQANLEVNAIQLRAIPEPSTALLGGLGMLALLRRRR